MKKGIVSLVGAGCGDPDFLTVKAQKRLRDCEVLVYDSLVSEQIVKQVPADCEKIYVGKRYGRHAMKQEGINALLLQRAQAGKRVVRLKGGDPYVFGRGGEEFLALMAEGIICEEIPGITSSIAVPAAAGIPVTHRGMSRSFTVITGTTANEDGQEGLQMDFETLAKLEGTLVILMGVHHLEKIAESLMQAGKSPQTPCAVIMEGTLAGQKCVRAPLIDIAARTAEAGIRPPAVIVVGAVAQLELLSQEKTGEASGFFAEDGYWQTEQDEALEKERKGCLSGITVGVTGTAHFAEKLSGALKEAGAAVCDMSFMEIREDPEVLPKLSSYGWLVFTSPNGVRIFLEKMKQEKKDLRSISQNKIAVIGPGTAQALEEAGIYADYMPQSYNAQHLAEGLTQRILEEADQKHTLFLRASKGSEALPKIFAEKGLPFTEFPLYEIGVDEKKREQAMKETPDYVVFGAGSGVRAYFDGKKRSVDAVVFGESTSDRNTSYEDGSDDRRIRYVCMGEVCGRELASFTKEKFLVAQESSVAGIVECICRNAEKRNKR